MYKASQLQPDFNLISSIFSVMTSKKKKKTNKINWVSKPINVPFKEWVEKQWFSLFVFLRNWRRLSMQLSWNLTFRGYLYVSMLSRIRMPFYIRCNSNREISYNICNLGQMHPVIYACGIWSVLATIMWHYLFSLKAMSSVIWARAKKGILSPQNVYSKIVDGCFEQM